MAISKIHQIRFPSELDYAITEIARESNTTFSEAVRALVFAGLNKRDEKFVEESLLAEKRNARLTADLAVQALAIVQAMAGKTGYTVNEVNEICVKAKARLDERWEK